MITIEIENQISLAFRNDDTSSMRKLLEEYPSIATMRTNWGTRWLAEAASEGCYEIVKLLVEAGADVNEPAGYPPLERAIIRGYLDIVNYLLRHGADIKLLDRPYICAINAPKHEMELVQLLVELGCDFNELHYFGGSDGPLFNSVQWAKMSGKMDIYDYLIRLGGTEPIVIYRPRPLSPLDQEIVAHFTETIGPSYILTWMDSIPRTPWINIHVIPATSTRPYQTLFTTGISSEVMAIPGGYELEAVAPYLYAELMIDIPADWDLSESGLSQEKHAWLIRELQHLGQTSYQEQEWYGDTYTIFANGEPPEPFSEGVPFTTMMCRPEGSIKTDLADPIVDPDNGKQYERRIQFYRVTPLTTAERDEVAYNGLDSLIAKFGGQLPHILDVNRSCVISNMTSE